MKKPIKLSITALLIGVGIFFWVKEPSLTLEATEWLKTAQKSPAGCESYNSFYTWAGISADKSEDALTIGKQIVVEYEDNPAVLELIDKYPVLPKDFTETEFSQLSQQPHELVQQLLTDNQVLIQRYQNVLRQAAVSPEYWSANTFMPDLAHLKNAQKLQWLLWWSQLQAGADPASITVAIEEQFAQFQLQINKADFLISKMMFNFLLKQHLQFHKNLIKNDFLPATTYPLLNTQDRSLRTVLHSEFYSAHQLLVEFKKSKQSLTDGEEAQTKALDILFKPNVSANFLQPSYATLADISEQQPEQLLLTQHDDLVIQPLPTWIKFYDPLSSILGDMKTPSYRPYMLRLLETNCLIDSFNQTQGQEVAVKSAKLQYCHSYNWQESNYR